MENPAVVFQSLLKQLSSMPYPLREKCCNDIQFLLEDYVKFFPPVSIKTYTTLFSALREIADFYVQDKNVLELGPGFSLGLIFLAALSGARKTWAADLFPHDMGPDNDYIVSMFEHIEKDSRFLVTMDQPWNTDRLATEFSKLIEKDAQNRFAFRKDKLEYLFPYSGENLPFTKETIDLSLSCAAFEHFRNPVAVVNELSRVTSPGGLSCHTIDFRDHRNFNLPLEFLTLTDDSWQQIHQNSFSYTYTNRLRHSQVVSVFDAGGFSLMGVRPLITLPIDQGTIQRLVAPYNTMPISELEILVQVYVFRKDHTPKSST